MNSRTIRAGLHFVCIMNYVTKIKICCHQQTNYFFFFTIITIIFVASCYVWKPISNS